MKTLESLFSILVIFMLLLTSMAMGQIWTQQTSGTTSNLLSVHFVNANKGWAVGENATILHTTNGGTDWEVQISGVSPSAGFNSVRFLNENIGFAGGKRAVVRTLDGGASWGGIQYSSGPAERYGLFPVSSTVAWAVGRDAIVIYPAQTYFRYTFESNGTVTENKWKFMATSILYDTYFTDPDTGFACGTHGIARLITNASGSSPNFESISPPGSMVLFGIQMLDSNNGWVVGEGGTIFYTDDRGQTWTQQSSGTTADLNDLHFVNLDTGLVVGDGGLILFTEDGGDTWTPETSGVSTDLHGVFFVNPGYAVGDNGVILKRIEPADVHIVIPDTTGQPASLVNIPINVITDVTGMGITSAEIELSWNQGVLDNATAALGEIVPTGWLFNYTSTPGSGQMTISMEGTEEGSPTDALAGTGSLVILTFEVVGQHCNTTIIHFDKMVFNGGIPPAISHDGLFHVFAYWDITGHITHCLSGDPVDEVIVPVVSTSYVDTTDQNGYYELLDLPTANYVVRPEKEDDLGTSLAIAVSAYDAAWILQHEVGLRTFTPYQMIAGDVSGNDSISAYDAAKVLQYGVDLINKFPVMPDTSHFWRFVPEDFPLTMTNWMNAPDSIAYTPLNSNVVDNYKAILYGDVSGNWHPTDGGLAKSIVANVDIRLEDVYGESGDRISLPMYIENASDIIAMNFTLQYDPQVLKAAGVSLASLTQDYLIAYDVKDGQIKVGLAGSQPIVGSGAIVNLEFEVLNTESKDVGSLLDITEMLINDGSIAANIQAARFEMGSPVPDEYALHQNYPNPFNPETMIKYQLPKAGKVVLNIYNTIGQEIKTLVNEQKEAGYHEASWDGRDNNGISVSAGVYIYRIQVGYFISNKKMLYMR